MIFLDVGARPVVPKIPGIETVNVLTNLNVMDLDVVPAHMLILGGSYIGLEFAQMFRRFGAEVTVIEAASRLLPREDDDISDAIREIVEGEGIRIFTDAKCTALAKDGDAIVASVESPNGKSQVTGSHLLVSVGRVPNTDGLGLEAAGVALDQRGFVQVNDFCQTSVPTIYAMGECNGRGNFTHTSYNDYEIVAANLLDGDKRRISDRILTYGLFIDPPLGRIGMTEAEARKTGRKLLLGKRLMTHVGRAVEKAETQGFMKVIIDAETKKILGAAILGTTGDEAVQCITAIMYADAPYTVLQRAVLIHPTVSELIPTMLGEMKEM
jgi:pyruvate/2-oxoglutarate dehydrogenase complex dihydrolipoamide dehydrogenase (E3) component